MKFSLLQPQAGGDTRQQLVIAPHHPDRLRRPAARPGAIDHERFQQALTWNVFRTLELLPPAFWLRRFHARLSGDPVAAAQILRVSLWQPAPLPPVQRIDGARPEVIVDVVVETEHAVWTLIVANDVHDPGDDQRVAQMVDAGAWLAGARQHHCGIIERETTAASLGGIVRNRYGRSRDSVELRSATRGPSAPTATTYGAIRWADLATILGDCRDARSLSAIERALAGNALDWLQSVGVRSAAG